MAVFIADAATKIYYELTNSMRRIDARFSKAACCLRCCHCRDGFWRPDRLHGAAFAVVQKENYDEMQYFGTVHDGAYELQFRVLGEDA